MRAALPHADEIAEAAAVCKELLAPVQAGAWTRRIGGTLVAVTGLPAATTNGVSAVTPNASARDIERALDAVAATGLPYGLQLRPSSVPGGAPAAERRELRRTAHSPVMALVDEPPATAAPPTGLRIAAITPEELPDLHAVLGAGFGATTADAARLVPPSSLGLPGVRGWFGRVDGVAVVAGITIATGDGVAVFDVATAPAHQRHGYGGALTAHAVREGFAAGARWAWLQATTAGRPVYERLGFATVERWTVYVSA